MLATLQVAMEIVQSLPENRSCLKCDYFETGGHCAHWRTRVPETARADGCTAWAEKIPF